MANGLEDVANEASSRDLPACLGDIPEQGENVCYGAVGLPPLPGIDRFCYHELKRHPYSYIR